MFKQTCSIWTNVRQYDNQAEVRQILHGLSEFVPGDKQPSVDSRARKMEKITMKPHTKAFILIATIYVFAYAVKGIV